MSAGVNQSITLKSRERAIRRVAAAVAGIGFSLLPQVGRGADSIPIPNSSFELPFVFNFAPYATATIASWQKSLAPAYFYTNFTQGPSESTAAFQARVNDSWHNNAGIFLNVPQAPIDNVDGRQSGFIFALPGNELYQDLSFTTGPSTGSPITYQAGLSYQLSFRIDGGGYGMELGVPLDFNLYYRDTSITSGDNRVNVGSFVVSNTHNPDPTTSISHLIDYTLNVPAAQSAAWIGKQIGVQIYSPYDDANTGGYWDVDYLRLTSTPSVNEWKTNGTGNFSGAANWSLNIPNKSVFADNEAGAVATFKTNSGAINVNPTVHVDTNVTVGAINFDTGATGIGYTLDSTGGDITLDNNSGGTNALPAHIGSGVNASINVTNGNHTITAPITIADHTDVNVAPGQSLTVGTVAHPATVTVNSGKNLNLQGPGTLNADNASVNNSGTINVNGGTNSIGAITGSGGVGIASSQTLKVRSITQSSVVSDGTLHITGTGSTLGSVSNNTAGHGTVQVDGDLTLTGTISPDTLTNTGTTNINGEGTITNVVNDGTLNIGGGDDLSSNIERLLDGPDAFLMDLTTVEAPASTGMMRAVRGRTSYWNRAAAPLPIESSDVIITSESPSVLVRSFEIKNFAFDPIPPAAIPDFPIQLLSGTAISYASTNTSNLASSVPEPNSSGFLITAGLYLLRRRRNGFNGRG